MGNQYMNGYTRKILRIDLSTQSISVEALSRDIIDEFVGGRGIAAKILWDEVKHVEPLSEHNKVIFTAGPLTGLPVPGGGKMVVASKSPLTGGYGDGNIGTRAAVHMRKSGYDAVIIEGKAKKPCYLSIINDQVTFMDASSMWGKNTFESQDILEKRHGKSCGILLIGPGGEQLVPYAVVMSQQGRAGGRPGIGAVMGSKNLKAVVFKGDLEIPVFDEARLKQLGRKAYKAILQHDNYPSWKEQGTMVMVDWNQANRCLPTHNYKEATFRHALQCNSGAMAKVRTGRRGCPNCNMHCGMIIDDSTDKRSEVDYENVGMLGPNIGLGSIEEIGVLNRMADEYGLDTISLGNCIGFLMEASEKGLTPQSIAWGDATACRALIQEIVGGTGLGKLISGGVRQAARLLGHSSHKWAMHVKGLEISAYDCHAWPAMALCYGTSPIGAHHKDGWVIGWEASDPGKSYSPAAVSEVIRQQRIKGGFFETATVCKFPMGEAGIGLESYLELLAAATGKNFTMGDFDIIGDRIFNLIRCYWIREHGRWERAMDYPPARWFEEPLADAANDLGRRGRIDIEKYDHMLSLYYKQRGWNDNGVPKKSTLQVFGLMDHLPKDE
jgi:aldehyde:ferredoxin oxidoreductase